MIRIRIPAMLVALALLLPLQRLVTQSSFPAAAVDSVFAAYNRTDRPGCAVGVYRNGRVAYARGYGMADLNQGIAISPKTVFYIASTSKQFTAASIMLLVTQGKISLDDPVRKYVPELPAYADAVTLRHLVHHLSGLRDYLGLWYISGRLGGDEIPEEAALDLIVRQKALDFTPGSHWAYSNSNYFLLSVIVRRVSGQSLRDYSTRNLFEPLGMQDTHFHDDRTMIVPRRAEGYEPTGAGGYRIVRTSFALVGDGGLHTTVEDLAKWDENFFSNTVGGGASFVQRLYTRGILTTGDTTEYAAGLFLKPYRGLPTVSHGGSFIGYRAELLRFPSMHTSIGILCNDYTADPSAMAQAVANVVLRAAFAKAAAPSAAVQSGAAARAPTTQRAPDSYLGRFEFLPGVAASVERASTGLTMKAMGRDWALTALNDSTYAADGLPGTLAFRRLANGRTGLMASSTMDAPAPPLLPVPVLSAADRAHVIGSYFSEELQATYVVKERDGRLMVRGGYGDWMPMEPFQPDQFSTGEAKATVLRDKSGKVTALVLDAARMKNIQLVRVR